jgi:hypothetical protein
MGSTGRVIRMVLAVAVAVLHFANLISGTAVIILGCLAIILLLTSMVGFCPWIKRWRQEIASTSFVELSLTMFYG